jgi:membrane-associated PAP2 superfamily phosphatase
MNRTSLIIALVIAAVSGLVFGLFPGPELRVSQYFHDVTDGSGTVFLWRVDPLLMLARNIGLWVSTAIIVPVLAAFAIKFILPTRKLLIPGRAIIFLTVTLALGPGLVVNVILKDHWGRSRPIDITQFGGTERYVRWWDPTGECPNNCSFVSGDVSGAFWTLAPAALTPLPYRPLAYGAALALGTAMSAFRIMAGGHFVSDVVFAGVFTFLIIWLAYALIYRWPRTRLSDARIEHAIERIAMPAYLALSSPFRKKKNGGGDDK